MFPENFQAVAVVLLAVVPGFLATTAWARAKTWKGPAGDLRTVLSSLALSAVIQVALAPLTLTWLYPVRKQLADYPLRVFTWSVLAVLVLPLAGGIGAGKLTELLADRKSPQVVGRLRRFVGTIWPASSAPSIWDWLFLTRPPFGAFLVIEFKDGSRRAGVFAEGSLALTSPERQGLYLISEWRLNQQGDILGPIPGSRGVMILDTEGIRSIRVVEADDD